MIKDKACRFLFSCFLYRAYKNDCDNNVGYELLARWSLEENGREDYYLILMLPTTLKSARFRRFKQSHTAPKINQKLNHIHESKNTNQKTA